MLSSKEKSRIKELHKVDFRGLIFAYGGIRSIFKSRLFWTACNFSLLFSTLLYLLIGIDQFINLINSICNIGLAIEGGLVGLSLAGLTLVVSFGGDKLINRIIKKAENDFFKKSKLKPSIYQSTISKFGYAVVIQIFSLFILFIIKLCADIKYSLPIDAALIINSITVFIALFFLTYSFLLTLQMTLNVFTLGQMNHFTLFMERILERQKQEQTKNDPS